MKCNDNRKYNGKSGLGVKDKLKVNMYCIYAIVRINETKNDLRAYIGISRSILNRKNKHTKRFKRGYNIKIIFKKDMTMYEAEKIEVEYMNEYIKQGYKLYNRLKCDKHNWCYDYDDVYLNDDLYNKHERETATKQENI